MLYPTMHLPPIRLVRFALGALLLSAVAVAQPTTGAIAGRVFNAATKEYVRNAEVRVEGTNLVGYSEDGGHYRLTGVQAGQAQVTVTDAAGAKAALSPVKAGPEENTAMADLTAPLAPGSYTISWVSGSPDGHVVRGKLAFSVGAPPAAAN